MKKKFFLFFLLIFYFFFQLSSLDYGTKINDINYIKNSHLDEETIKNFVQSKQALKQTDIKNNNEKWIYHGYWNIWRRRRRITINKMVTGTNHGQGSAEMKNGVW